MTVWFEGAHGARLAADLYGPDEGAPVILIGGMGQTRHSWRRAAERIAEQGRRAITIDLRGHGESGWASDGRYGFAQYVADLTCAVRQIGRPCILVGASLGGKISLATAGYSGPEIACALVLVDTVPRTRPEGVVNVTQSMRPPSDGFSSPEEAAATLARQRNRPVDPGAGERLRRNMRMDEAGRWHWHWDPLVMSADHGIGLLPAMDYLETAASAVTVPALITRGELSDVVDDAGISALRALMPQAEVEVIPGAGHMIVGDRNDVFADALLNFLYRTPGL